MCENGLRKRKEENTEKQTGRGGEEEEDRLRALTRGGSEWVGKIGIYSCVPKEQDQVELFVSVLPLFLRLCVSICIIIVVVFIISLLFECMYVIHVYVCMYV